MLVSELLSQRAGREERRDWWQAAACRTADPDIFFPVSAYGPGQEDIAQAKAVCAECPVRRQCLQFALATHQVHGVWGGTTEEERRLHMRARSAVPAPRETTALASRETTARETAAPASRETAARETAVRETTARETAVRGTAVPAPRGSD